MVAPSAGPFFDARSLGSGNSPAVHVANFNANETPDLLGSYGVLLDGVTLVPLHSGGATSRSVMTAAAGDFNANGRMDAAIVVAYNDGTYPQPIRIELYYGNGTGGFQYAGAFGSLGWVYSFEAGDVNRDGRSDLVVGSSSSSGPQNRLDVFLASDAGLTFRTGPTLTSQPLSVTVSDLDRNGTLDLAVALGYGGNSIQLFDGDGQGGFAAGELLTASHAMYSVRAADVNRDAVPDIVGGGDGAMAVWLGSSTGSYAPPQYHATGSYSFYFVIADLTGDGNPDILTDEGALLRGTTDGTFSAPSPVNIAFDAAAPVDYDRDGRMDLVIVNYSHTMVLFTRSSRGPNVAPVAISGPDYTIPYQAQFPDEPDCGGPGPSYDPNLDALTFEWRDESGRIVATGEVLCTAPYPSGTHTFTLVVRDGHGGESSDSKTITITPLKESVAVLEYNGDPHGNWQRVTDSTAAAGFRMWHPDAGVAKLTPALANPTHYVDTWMLVDPTRTYKLSVRLKPQNDSWANDSVFVQFAGGAVSRSTTRYATGTTDALDVNLEECSGCGVSGWGWRDERWGTALKASPVLLRFPAGGWQHLRVQTREDGVSIDQVVLSSEQYLNAPPGPAKRDATILPPKPW